VAFQQIIIDFCVYSINPSKRICFPQVYFSSSRRVGSEEVIDLVNHLDT
tara:strand:+ start:546 stop:692 length:147 start_codon:yes stop_codon:yes gene_type:complete